MVVQMDVAVDNKIILLFLLMPLVGFCQAPVGTFSSLNYNQESGDLNGYELTFIPTDSGVKAVVEIAEDGVNEVHLTSVNSTGDNLRFFVVADDGSKVDFTMRCSSSHCRGAYTWRKATVKISLEKRPSYWSRNKTP